MTQAAERISVRRMAAGGRRFVVIGTTGSGKTAVALDLSQRLGIPYVEMDALHWGPDWTEVPDTVFRQKVLDALSTDSWVVDGNYHQVRDIVWPRASTVIWLDYPFTVVLRQLLVRTLRRALRQEALWNGNRERLRTHFLSRDSLFLWFFKTYWRRRREYPVLLRQPEYAHLLVVRLPSRQRTQAWLDGVAGRFQRRAAQQL